MSENLVTIPSDEKYSAGPDEEHTEDSNQNKSSTDAKSPEEIIISEKVELIITEDDIHEIKADVILCMWSDEMLNVGPAHPLLQSTGVKLKNWSEFKEEIRSGQVKKTDSGLEGIGQMLHYKTARNLKEIIEKMFHVCKDSSVVVIPLSYNEVLYRNVTATVQVLSRLVINIQRCQRECSIRKIIVSCGSKETKDHLDEQIKKTESKEFCISCKKQPAAKIRHLSKHCDESCPSFCVDCLRQSRQNPLHCSDHGRCFSPVGDENCFALIIAGHDYHKASAEIFINDAKTMKKKLQDPNIIGIREENITMIKTSQPAEEDYFMCERVIQAFTEFGQQIREKEHPFFLLYFSGHCDQTSLCFGGPSSGMTPEKIKEELQSLNAETVMIILDCCYSGGIDLTEFNDEDFTMSLQRIESKDNENCVLIPKLWNFDKEGVLGVKNHRIRVKQWASSYPNQLSFFITDLNFSLFTVCVIHLLEGHCPVEAEDCEICQKYHLTAAEEEFVFLNNLHECVGHHMEKLAQKYNKEQQPQLDGNDDDDMVIAFYLSET